MTTEELKLQTAVTAIKEGNKATGRQILVEILQENPANDRAWVWMSSVVETDDMRRECLREALNHNPHNQAAKKGLNKLQQTADHQTPTPTVTGKERFLPPQESTPPQQAGINTAALSNDNQATIEYICKRLILEKHYNVLALDENPTVPILNPEHFQFPIPVEVIPELLPLQPYFDLILFRQTGARFEAICLKVCRSKGEPEPVTQAQLIAAGQACLQYSNVVAYGQVSPVFIRVWELFERKFTPDDEQRLQKLKRIPGRKKVGVQVQAIDKLSRQIIYSSALFRFSGGRRYIQSLINEEHQFSEEQLLTALVNSRIEILPIIAGIVTGVTLGIGLRLIANMLGWLYSPVIDIFIVFIVASLAIYLPKFKLYSRWQGVLASVGFGVVLYGILLLLLNYEPSIWYAILVVIFAMWGRFLGAIVEP